MPIGDLGKDIGQEGGIVPPRKLFSPPSWTRGEVTTPEVRVRLRENMRNQGFRNLVPGQAALLDDNENTSAFVWWLDPGRYRITRIAGDADLQNFVRISTASKEFPYPAIAKITELTNRDIDRIDFEIPLVRTCVRIEFLALWGPNDWREAVGRQDFTHQWLEFQQEDRVDADFNDLIVRITQVA